MQYEKDMDLEGLRKGCEVEKYSQQFYRNEKRTKSKKALRKSIKHWCVDIRRRLINGDVIEYPQIKWRYEKTNAAIYNTSCELCRVFRSNCVDCPLSNIGAECNTQCSPYGVFRDTLDLKSANVMIETLIECYKRI